MNKEAARQTAEGLMRYIEASPSAYHAVEEGVRLLLEAGFVEWTGSEKEPVKEGAKLFCRPYPTCLFAFRIGDEGNLKIAGAHTDSPCFHIKPNPDCPQKAYLRLNTDVYGGPIHNSWLDRPLSIAGSVAVKGKEGEGAQLRLFDAKRPVLTIPNLAIHMNRDANKGYEWNPQTDLLPLFGMQLQEEEQTSEGDGKENSESNNHKDVFLSFLARELGVAREDLIDYDLFVYNAEKPLFLGRNEELLSSPRIDNLTSCYALLSAIATEKKTSGTSVIALYDHEEIGSQTARGADSRTLLMLLENLYEAMGKTHQQLNADILKGTLLSVDVAHAMHPNFPAKNDPTTIPMINDGVVFKLNSNQRYINNLEVLSRLEMMCEMEGISFTKYVNRSDVAGGGTIGNRMASWLPMCGLDMGVPILAMHSARELMGTQDQLVLEKLVESFFVKS